MIRVMLFASLREKLACESLDIPPVSGQETVSELIDRLIARQGGNWQEVLRDTKVMVAVNQEVVDLQASVGADDEVAFFPPMTGG